MPPRVFEMFCFYFFLSSISLHLSPHEKKCDRNMLWELKERKDCDNWGEIWENCVTGMKPEEGDEQRDVYGEVLVPFFMVS